MSNPTELQGLAYDKDMDRHYIPLPGGWEIQTKGKGSTFRIAHAGSGRRWMVLDDQLHDPLVALANAVREALARRAQPEGEAPQAEHSRFGSLEMQARILSNLVPATLSPLCGAQPAESVSALGQVQYSAPITVMSMTLRKREFLEQKGYSVVGYVMKDAKQDRCTVAHGKVEWKEGSESNG